uniref:LysR family transcriptional regulator n=1 Tax=Anisakis simplex TaxID=6269 RepID=A0A0M3JJP0_ANISI
LAHQVNEVSLASQVQEEKQVMPESPVIFVHHRVAFKT